MSTNYYPDIVNQTNVYTNTLNPIYSEAQKRDTIYENVKVLKPIVLPPKKNNSYVTNNQIVNYENNENLFTEYPITNYNQEFTEETINKYFNQTTTELSSENNYENYFNGTYNNINNDNNGTYQNYEKYFNQSKNSYYPSIGEVEFAEIKRITNDNKTINQNLNKATNANQINQINQINKIQINQKEQIAKIPIEKEMAQVRKITEENLEKPQKEINQPSVTTLQTPNPPVQNNINITEKKNTKMIYPGPAKISKMPNITIPLNPRVRVAREEKKINIVKLTEENNAINNNKINNENKINNNINLNINKNIENNNDYNENENGIPTVEEKKENILTNINSVNFTKPNMRDEIQDEIEINKVNDVNEPLEVSPMDDYNFSSKTPNRKFHRVKILKKNPSNQLFPHSELLNLENYNYMNKTQNIYQKEKINKITFNNKLNKTQKKEGNAFMAVKKIIPKKNNYNKNMKNEYEMENNIRFNNYQMDNNNDKNSEEENSENDRHSSDFEDNFDNFNDDEVKDTDEIVVYKKKDVNKDINNINDNKNYDNNIKEIKKEDSLVKKIKNDDWLDDLDNAFNRHDKFYRKMKNLLDENF
jgi:hypothetical protein